MIEVKQVNQLHEEAVRRWHVQSIDNPYQGVWSIIGKQHSYNFLLWHEEDVARSPEASDRRIADVKRSIDRYNQQRNDWIEKIDDWLAGHLAELRVAPSQTAPLNTETPGSAIDRLSILALRIYHLREQLERSDVAPAHQESVQNKLAVCLIQQQDLSHSLQELLQDIRAGRKRHRTYRQFKMYNDPTLNPYLYRATTQRTG